MGADVTPARECIEAAIAAAAGRPMAWGRDDCCLWAAGIVRALTGSDPAAAWRGYRTPGGALRRLSRGGVPAALAEAARAQGWPEIDCVDAATGDLGAVVSPSRRPFQGAAVIRLDGWWVGREDGGVGFLPANAVTHAWRLPVCRP